jgi:hypothetical protein
MNSQERSNRLENLRWRFWNVSMQKKHGGRKMLCCLQAFFKVRVISIVLSDVCEFGCCACVVANTSG